MKLAQRIATIDDGLDEIGARGDGAIESSDRFVMPIERCQRSATVRMQLGRFRLQCDRAIEACDCIRVLTQRRQDIAASVPSLEPARSLRQIKVVGLDRLALTPQRDKQRRAIDKRFGKIWLELNRPIKTLQGFVVRAAFPQRHAEEVVRGRMLGCDFDRLAQGIRGVLE